MEIFLLPCISGTWVNFMLSWYLAALKLGALSTVPSMTELLFQDLEIWRDSNILKHAASGLLANREL